VFYKLLFLFCCRLSIVQTYKRQRETYVNEESKEKAIRAVLNGMTLRNAANLFYRIQKKENPKKKRDFSTKYTVNLLFTTQKEDMLEKHIIKCSRMMYGLNYTEIHQLAFDDDKKLDSCPQKWQEVGIVGLEWVKCFMKHQSHLSLRKPENTSLARATGSNQHNVTKFHHDYRELPVNFKFTSDQIYNLHENGVTTVVPAPHIVAQTGVKQVGQVVSAEKGQLITVCTIINARENTLISCFLFSFLPKCMMHKKINAPGLLSGQMPNKWLDDRSFFLKLLKQIKKNIRRS